VKGKRKVISHSGSVGIKYQKGFFTVKPKLGRPGGKIMIRRLQTPPVLFQRKVTIRSAGVYARAV